MQNLQGLMKEIVEKARKKPMKIVLPESSDERILEATEKVLSNKVADIVLLGNVDEIMEKAKKLKIDISKAKIIDPKESVLHDKYAKKLYSLRKSRGMTLENAKELVIKLNYFATMMVKMNDADGVVMGSSWPTRDTLIPAFQVIGTKQRFAKVSGVFFMFLEEGKRLLFFADSAVTINPDAKDLAEIAIDTAKTAEAFNITPKIAMLSFSTMGSAKHPLVDKVKEATQIVKYKKPSLDIDGEVQVDAALSGDVCDIKCPECTLHGKANVLIFPDLQSGNIAYKIVERLGHADAIGPILQGLKKPVNDLSRGCNAEDIAKIIAITVVQAQHHKPFPE